MPNTTEHVDTVIIGGGQAGLVAGHELAKRGREFIILDAHLRVGDAWRTRWDSLRLFTPRRDAALPGLKMSGRQSLAPTKDEMADYLESYAAHHALPMRSGVHVMRLSKPYGAHGPFVVEMADGGLTATNVIVATGSYGKAKVPLFAAELDGHVVQLHSSDYRNPGQLQPGGVLLVGAGNSGADISLDVVGSHPTWLAGPEVPHIPPDIDKLFARVVVVRIVRFVQRNVLCLRNPIGRRAARKMRTTPLIRVKPKWLERAGVQRVGRVVGVRDGLPQLEDGQVLDVTNVIWCTGFHDDVAWIELPGTGEVEPRGVSTEVPGLYFLGREFQYALASTTLWGIARDAAYTAKHLASTRPAATQPMAPLSA